MKKLVISMLLAGLVFGLAAFAELAPKIGSPAPGLELPNLDGQTINLQSYLNKKPIVLVFFASWSKSCQTELNDLHELFLAREGKLEVLAVSFDKKQKELKAFLAKNKYSFPFVTDKSLSTLDKFQILIIPTTFCINRSGAIDKILVDYDENVKRAIAEWVLQNG